MSAAPIFGPIRKINCREFQQMIDMGLFRADEKLELVDGVIVELSPQGVPHSMAISNVTRWLAKVVPDDCFLMVQQPVLVNDDTLREPDLAIVAGSPADYLQSGQHPQSEDIRLLIEVADSSVGDDTRRKHTLYAKGGIPEFWVVNLPARRLEVHTEPGPNGYGVITLLDEYHEVAPGALPHATIEVGRLLPPRP